VVLKHAISAFAIEYFYNNLIIGLVTAVSVAF